MHTLKKIIRQYMLLVTIVLLLVLWIIIFSFQMVNEQQQAYLQAKDTFYQINQVLGENEEELNEVKQSYKKTCLHNAEVIARIIEENPSVLDSVKELKEIATMVEVDEIHIFDEAGRIFSGTHPEYYNYTFDSGEQIGFFKPLLKNKSLRLVQDITPNTAENKLVQYSALWSENKKFIVQVGMEPVNVLKVTEKNELSHIFSLLRVNAEANYYAIDQESGEIVGSTDLSCVNTDSSEIGLDIKNIAVDQNGFYANVNNIRSYCVFMESGENYIGRVISCQEMYRQIPITMFVFTLCLLFVVIILFNVVTHYMNEYVVESINKVNDKLRSISQGNLDETVDVKNSVELMELSRYINQMKKSIMENNSKMAYVIGKTKMLIGVYEYTPYKKKVHMSEYVSTIFSLEAEELENLSADYSLFVDFIDELRQNIVDGETNVYYYRKRYIKLDEIKYYTDVFGVVIDVTKEFEKRKQLEEEREAKSRFLSNMSHEIRTPINAVLGMNEMILREAHDEQILKYSSNIQSSGKMLLSLVNDVLDMSKIESGKMEIIPVEYKVSTLLMDLWNVIYLRAKKKNLIFEVELDETLPCVLYGDDVRIKQIVTNLLTNAVKYTPEGSVRLKIAYERQDDHGDELILKISVQDTGIGIREEDREKLFDSFQRLDEEKNRNIEGTGLGMNITISLLERMGGELQLESEYQKGSVFTAVIPQKIISEEPIGSFQEVQERNAQQSGSKQGRFTAPEGCVLVVDDNEMNRTVFQALLKRTKMQLVAAESGEECLEYVQKQKFHIIFMDHMMPGMDGIDTLHEIKKLAKDADFPNKETPVVALTANAVAGAREMYLSEGFEDFLTKPIDAELLEQMICNYIPAELIQTVEETDRDSELQNGMEEYDVYQDRGISIRDGLKHSQGNVETYMELVRMFIRDGNKIELLREYVDTHNMKEYAIQVHALKGNARTLGADQLANVAYEHEIESKKKQEDYVRAHWEELQQIWETTLETFQEIYQRYAPRQEETDITYDGELLALSQEELDEMAELIDDFKTDAAVEQIKDWLKNPLPQDMKQRLMDVLEAIEDEYDEDKAIMILKKGEEDEK